MDTGQQRRRWPNIYPTLGRCRLVIAASSKLQAIPDLQLLFPANTLYKCFCVYGLECSSQQTRGVEPVLVWCWASDEDHWQHWFNILSAGSVDKCLAPKMNKFRLIHRPYCPQEPFINIFYKSHWHYIYYLPTFMVMLLEGETSSVFCSQKLDPSSFTRCCVFQVVRCCRLLSMP